MCPRFVQRLAGRPAVVKCLSSLYSVLTMYTIGEAAERAGLSVEVLRAWERRYGVVTPRRTEAGYRLYDTPTIQRLQTMRRLVEEGWTPSAAAASLRGVADADLASAAPRSAAGEDGVEGDLSQRF